MELSSDIGPHVEALLQVSDACRDAGWVIAEAIWIQQPHRNFEEIAEFVSGELFLAAQDCASALLGTPPVDRAR